MSHPAASIKSIYSGKMNIDTPELETFDFQVKDPELDDDNLSKYSGGLLSPKINAFDNTNDSFDISDTNSDNEAGNLLIPSPTLLRNSTSSCLSTTATKDGIQGRHLRKGHNPYSNQMIANMIKNIDDRKRSLVLLSPQEPEPPFEGYVKKETTTTTETDTLSSVGTTDATVNGKTGHLANDPLKQEPQMSTVSKVELLTSISTSK